MMIETVSKWIVILFGAYIIVVGFVMLFKPEKARSTLRKAGSTNLINYSEITIRLVPAIALILYASYAKVPIAFTLFGWIMVITSVILYMVPRRLHHQFSMKSADVLKPLYWQLLSPFAVLFGGLIIYNVM